MRFRRRRRPRVQWLPNTGTQLGTNRGSLDVSAQPAAIEFADLFDYAIPRVVETPLVLDNPREAAKAGAPLNVVQLQGLNFNAEWGYRLRRIVGKLHISAQAVQQASAFAALWVKVGFIVRRVDAQTGASLAQANDTDPTALENVTDPWIWQRNYIIGTGGSAGGSTGAIEPAFQLLAQNTVDVGGTKDGPAFDIKTARRLGPEERLFVDVSVVGLPLTADGAVVSAQSINFYFWMDYRVLGTISSAAGNRRNASR